MEIWPIKSDEVHRAALKEIEALWGAEERTPKGDRLDLLGTMVGIYEDQRWPIDKRLTHDEKLDPLYLP